MTNASGVSVRGVRTTYYYMAVAASGTNTEILQFEWFISGRIFPILPAQEGENLENLAYVE